MTFSQSVSAEEKGDEQFLESVFTLKMSGAKTSDLRCSFISFQNLTEIREDKSKCNKLTRGLKIKVG